MTTLVWYIIVSFLLYFTLTYRWDATEAKIREVNDLNNNLHVMVMDIVNIFFRNWLNILLSLGAMYILGHSLYIVHDHSLQHQESTALLMFLVQLLAAAFGALMSTIAYDKRNPSS
ncbi:MAG: hypothetical protein ACPGO5_04820 [Patescibacteria group bacterium]